MLKIKLLLSLFLLLPHIANAKVIGFQDEITETELSLVVEKFKPAGKNVVADCSLVESVNFENDLCLNDISKYVIENKLAEHIVIRVIRHNGMVTMDYSATRLNVNLNKHGVVGTLSVG